MNELTEEEEDLLRKLLEAMSDYSYAEMWVKTDTIKHCAARIGRIARSVEFKTFDEIQEALGLKP